MSRLLDKFAVFYFASHIPITILVDTQALLPAKYYPEQLVQLKTWYTQEFKDCLMETPPAWFLSFVVCEMLLQFPYFFIAVYAFTKGAKKCSWIRVPNMIYCSHVITTLIAILTHLWLDDFSEVKVPHPTTTKERLTLISIYSFYFFTPLIMLLDCVFSSVYRPVPVAQGNKKKR